jgi:hypothetical protein
LGLFHVDLSVGTAAEGATFVALEASLRRAESARHVPAGPSMNTRTYRGRAAAPATLAWRHHRTVRAEFAPL